MKPHNLPTILIADADRTTRHLLDSLLGPEGYPIIATSKGMEAFALAKRQQPALVLLNKALPDTDGYTLCRRLRQDPATRAIPVLMLADDDSVPARIAGFEAGADDYLVKPFHPKELAFRVKNLIGRAATAAATRAPEKQRGRIVAFFSAKGGAGKTTLSVNVAVALSRRSATRVVLVDADLPLGTVGVSLDLATTHTIGDLSGHFHELDSDLLEQVVVRHASGLDILQSPLRPEEAERITPANMKQLLVFLAEHYDYVIVDCQSSYDERTVSILETVDDIMLIVLPEIHSIKNVALFLDLATRLGLAPDKNHVVLNRADSNAGIRLEDIEAALQHPIDYHVGSGGRQFISSANQGVALVDDRPGSPLAQQLVQIAEGIQRLPPPLAWKDREEVLAATPVALPPQRSTVRVEKQAIALSSPS